MPSAPLKARSSAARSSTSAIATSAPASPHAFPLAASCNTTRTLFFCRSNVSATTLPVFPEAPSTTNIASLLRVARLQVATKNLRPPTQTRTVHQLSPNSPSSPSTRVGSRRLTHLLSRCLCAFGRRVGGHRSRERIVQRVARVLCPRSSLTGCALPLLHELHVVLGLVQASEVGHFSPDRLESF